MVQVQYCCLSCYSSHYYLTCPTYPKKVLSSANLINDSTSSSFINKSSSILIMDIFIKFYYLLFRNIRNMITYICHFLYSQGIAFSRINYCHNTAIKCSQEKKEFLFQNMQQNNKEIVKVKYQSKSDNTFNRNHISNNSNVSRNQHCKTTSTFLLVLLVFFNLISTKQSVTGKRQH